MKFFFLTLILAITSLPSKSQNLKIFKNKPWEDVKLHRLLRDTLQRINPLNKSYFSSPAKNKTDVVAIELKGIYSGSNSKGDIYIMQTDNMPCLVSSKEIILNMPVAGAEATDRDLFPGLIKPQIGTLQKR